MAREGSETAAQREGSLWQDKPVYTVTGRARPISGPKPTTNSTHAHTPHTPHVRRATSPQPDRALSVCILHFLRSNLPLYVW